MPTKHECLSEDAQYIPHWFSQRKNGDAPPVRACQAEGAVSVGGGLPTDGRWPRTITPHVWEIEASH
eukprot:9383225-Pyramimonas_sp.AAC.1